MFSYRRKQHSLGFQTPKTLYCAGKIDTRWQREKWKEVMLHCHSSVSQRKDFSFAFISDKFIIFCRLSEAKIPRDKCLGWIPTQKSSLTFSEQQQQLPLQSIFLHCGTFIVLLIAQTIDLLIPVWSKGRCLVMGVECYALIFVSFYESCPLEKLTHTMPGVLTYAGTCI